MTVINNRKYDELHRMLTVINYPSSVLLFAPKTSERLQVLMNVADFNQSHGLFLDSNCMHFFLQRFSLTKVQLNQWVKSESKQTKFEMSQLSKT